MPMDTDTHEALKLHEPTPDEVNGRSNADILHSLNHPADHIYSPCAEASPNPNIPKGAIQKYKDWSNSTVFPDTVRSLFLYKPPITAEVYNLIIFNDGKGYFHNQGPVRATQVLDTLHASGEIEPTCAIFVDPGRPPGAAPMGTTTKYDAAATQRSFEYDSLTSTYADFLLADVLPWVALKLNVAFTNDPSKRTICGMSSGGICAFNVAWHQPDQFARVISHCGSYTNIRGGHNYPYLVRTTPRKPIRVYLQSGENDGATLFGDWPTANMAMAKALDYAGYDYKFDFGQGCHSLRHGGAVFAETLRWIWRE